MKNLRNLAGGAARSVVMERELLEEAEAIEHLARLVSYGPDKARLMAQAQMLRTRAQSLGEERSWAPAAGEQRRDA